MKIKLLVKAEMYISLNVCDSCKNTKKTYNKRHNNISNFYFYIVMFNYSHSI